MRFVSEQRFMALVQLNQALAKKVEELSGQVEDHRQRLETLEKKPSPQGRRRNRKAS